jgi:SAM-dependent methyltransferase
MAEYVNVRPESGVAMTASRRAAAELVILSFIVLFQELALIRWFPGQVRVLAYFPNIVLISAFLGLGIGSLRAGKRSLLWLWPASLLVLQAAAALLSRVAFTSEAASEHLWLLYMDIPNAPVVNDVRPPLVIAFILTALSFVSLGQMVGERLHVFASGKKSLWGYVADLSGSLLGVVLFAFASFLQTFPVVWFAVFLIPGFWFFWRRGRLAAVAYAVAVVASLAIVTQTEKAQLYSPYYALSAHRSGTGGVTILTNGSLHQYAAPLSSRRKHTRQYDATISRGYPFPYQQLQFRPEKVLVLGAGSGNDVAVALERGAARVDAVEIDPAIIKLGREMHPERPYDSPRVRIINNDARDYLRNTKEKYDLIVFGTLDSMTRLSALSNVRLDNFVYTVECLQAARERLTPRGGVALYFMVASPEIHLKLFSILHRAFGEPPLVWKTHYNLFNEIFLSGPAFDHLRRVVPMHEGIVALADTVERPTDDWPYLYLDQRGVSSFYLGMIAIFALLAIVGIYLAAPTMFRAGAHFDGEMFLFGLAFLLLETKLVTQMSLVWGATWVTSAVVFASILLMVLLGTILMQLRPIGSPLPEIGLIAALLITYLLPTQWLLFGGLATRLLLSIVFVGAPIFFASICFAIRFRDRAEPQLAFGWNLLGAVIGGLMEFLSMAIGFRALALVATVAYLLSFLLARRRMSGASEPLAS